MKTLVWNCRGLGNTSLVQLISKIAEITNPSILFLMETKQKKRKGKYWTHKWNFENFCEVERVGLSGGAFIVLEEYQFECIRCYKKFHPY